MHWLELAFFRTDGHVEHGVGLVHGGGDIEETCVWVSGCRMENLATGSEVVAGVIELWHGPKVGMRLRRCQLDDHLWCCCQFISHLWTILWCIIFCYFDDIGCRCCWWVLYGNVFISIAFLNGVLGRVINISDRLAACTMPCWRPAPSYWTRDKFFILGAKK